MEFCGKLMSNGITKDKLNQALDIFSRLCNICNGDECHNDCPLRCGERCFFMCGKDKIYQRVAQIFELTYADKLAGILDVKVDEPFKAIINGKAESCMLCHDGMHFREEKTPNPKLLEDIITGVVRIVK